MSIRVLYIGEVVGKAGVFAVKKLLPGLKAELRPDFIVANVAGATGGAGVGKAHALYLRKLGIDCMTTGESAFYKKDIVELFPKAPWLLRPANHPPGVPGRGLRIMRSDSAALAVVQLLGQAGFGRIHLDNPFLILDSILDELRRERVAAIVDFRAATTAEKQALFRHADGRVAALVGSYARSLSADARIGPGGSAYLGDAGMSGCIGGVAGMDPDAKVREYLSGIPVWAKETAGPVELQGCVIDIDEGGKARAIEALRIACPEEFHERARHTD